MKKLLTRHFLTAVILTIYLGVVCLTGAGCDLLPDLVPTPGGTPPVSSPNPPLDTEWTPPPISNVPALPSIADVVAKVKPSVVAINVEVQGFDIFRQPYTQEGAGSGWIIRQDGLIVTNNHVVEGADRITVTLADGRVVPVNAGTVVTDPLTDLAVLKIDVQGLTAATLGRSADMRVGDWVVAIGNPLGQGISAKEGIVSRQDVSVTVDQDQTLHDLIETSAAINPGNSGGPLLNMAGQVIGITSVKIAVTGVEGMGYAISIDSAQPIIESLIRTGRVVRPWLGVTSRTVDGELVLQYNLAVGKGAFLVGVVSGSPAARAGLRAEDVIVKFDGQDIANAQGLQRAIFAARIGQQVEIVYWRGKNQQTARATLEERPPG